MSDDDLIRRGDARRVMLAYASAYSAEQAETAIAALPAAPTFTAADLERDWQPIETAPKEDGVLHVRGVWVYCASTGKKLYFDACAGYLESGDFLSADGEDHGWRPEDYTHWMPLPPPPADLAQRVKE